MNPSDIFKTALGTAAGAVAPVSTSLFKLGSSLFSNNSSPKDTYTSSLMSSGASSPAPAITQPKAPVSSTGGNVSATSPGTPKDAYINSQSGLTGSTSSGYTNPNFSMQGSGSASTPPGNSSTPTQDAYQSAFSSYLASLQPSDAEAQAEKDLSAQQLQSSKDNDYALDRPGQTLGFSSGEAQRVARNNAYQTDALSNKVNALTGARTARTNATKAQLDFEKGLYDDSVTAAKPDYTTVSPGSTLFDNKTGKSIFTAPTAASQAPSGGSGYVAGTDPIADGWVTAINNKQATLTQVPAAYKNIVAQGLAASNSGDELKTNALTSAQQLLSTFQNSSGVFGTGIGGAKAAVGASSVIPAIPGTQEADFLKNLDNLKSLLSLDNVKYLKGQGAVSDAERKLLADSATQLSQAQSETEFEKTLQGIITKLSNFGSPGGAGSAGGISVSAGGQTYTFPDQDSADAFKKAAGL